LVSTVIISSVFNIRFHYPHPHLDPSSGISIITLTVEDVIVAFFGTFWYFLVTIIAGVYLFLPKTRHFFSLAKKKQQLKSVAIEEQETDLVEERSQAAEYTCPNCGAKISGKKTSCPDCGTELN